MLAPEASIGNEREPGELRAKGKQPRGYKDMCIEICMQTKLI